MKITKRMLINFISYATALVVVVTAFVIVTNNDIKDFKTQIGYGHSMNLNELDGSLYNISIALHKTMYASTATQFNSLAAELCTESTVAKNSLSQIPYLNDELEGINKFLSQVGDYTLYLSKKVIQGDKISESERENLYSLSKTAEVLSTGVNNVRTEYDKDGVWDRELTNLLNQSVENSIETDLLGLEELLVDYPTLIYDGPFSDHIEGAEAKFLKDKNDVAEEDAKNIAAKSLGIDASLLESNGLSGGKIECYDFVYGEMSASVTKKGGLLVYMRKYRVVTEGTINYDEAVEIAKTQINSNSGTSFVPTYHFADEGVLTVNFAHKEGATLCYPDLVKVGVALDTGEIVMVEAAGYLANHFTRTIVTPKYSADEAGSVLSENVKVNSVKRVIIPSDGGSEKHCYEFNCTGNMGEELLIYINVQNLQEEQILILLKTDGGVLVK